jgi:ABC-type histidine transport system ATPase subunit
MVLASEMILARDVSDVVCFLDNGAICESGRQTRSLPARGTHQPGVLPPHPPAKPP